MRPEMEAFREVFCAEAADLLAEMERGLSTLEGSFDPDVVRGVFRAAHTLKGNAALLGFEAVARLAHAAEDLAEALSTQEAPPTPELLRLLLQAVDALRAQLGLGRGGEGSSHVDAEDVERRLVEAVRARGL